MTQTKAGFETMDDTKIAGKSLKEAPFTSVVKGKYVKVDVAQNGTVAFSVVDNPTPTPGA